MAKKWEVQIDDKLIILKNANGSFKKDTIYGKVTDITEKAYIVTREDGKIQEFIKENEDTVFRKWFKKG